MDLNELKVEHHILVDQSIELGTELLQGNSSNNPLYQLAEGQHLLDQNDGKFVILLFLRCCKREDYRYPTIIIYNYLTHPG